MKVMKFGFQYVIHSHVDIALSVNGERVSRRVEPRQHLIDFLRTELGLTGSHTGCEHGVCGACTVRVNGQIVRGCLVLAAQLDGAEIETIEGLSDTGEIRDLQTAEMAVQAALTGHLVFSTLHTNDAPSAVSRLMELGIPAYLINATLLGVLAQRLVRTLCSNCREKDDATPREAVSDLVSPWQINGGYRPFKPVGCVDCRLTGYRGRMGLYELLTVTEGFKEKVSKEPNIDSLRKQAVHDGMRPLRLGGALKVAEGVTTIDEILASTPPMS